MGGRRSCRGLCSDFAGQLVLRVLLVALPRLALPICSPGYEDSDGDGTCTVCAKGTFKQAQGEKGSARAGQPLALLCVRAWTQPWSPPQF